ncbi:MAG: hypothetical protein M1366_04650 [Patescibacteria group bacterium]|nr:hypothetical protein [Patescibacteria group bacterium]
MTTPLSLTSLKKQFPHITRIIAAPLQIFSFRNIFLSVVLLFLSINTILPITNPKNHIKKIKQEILATPFTSALHEELGQSYLNINKDASYHEYILAQEYFNNLEEANIPASSEKGSKVLGSQSQNSNILSVWDKNKTYNTTSPMDKLGNILTAKERLDQEKAYWQSVNLTHPNYLYAYMRLAVISLEEEDKNSASNYIKILNQNAPFDPTVIELTRKLKEE